MGEGIKGCWRRRLYNTWEPNASKILFDVGHVQLFDDGTAAAVARRLRPLHQVLAQFRQLLDEQLEHALRQRALQHVEQFGGLSAHDHRIGQMLDAAFHVTLLQVRLAHLHLLQEEPLHRLLVREVRERGLGGTRRVLLFPRHQPLLAQVRLEVRVAAALPVEVDAVAHEAQARDAGRRRADGRLGDFGLYEQTNAQKLETSREIQERLSVENATNRPLKHIRSLSKTKRQGKAYFVDIIPYG